MIHSYEYCKEKIGDFGKVTQIKSSFVVVKGFKNGFCGEGVSFEDGSSGMVISLEEDKTNIVVLSKESPDFGTKATLTGSSIHVSVGDNIKGHILSPLGYLHDEGKEPSQDSESRKIDELSLGIAQRSKIHKFLETGTSICDLVVPIGEGQRELIIGDRKTGKTHFVTQTIINQARKGKACILALIGKKESEVHAVVNFLKKENVWDKVIIVASFADESPGLIYLTPYTAFAIAEHFRDDGVDSLIVLDDLVTHAKYYREISLLAGKFPGRESYPGDIFFNHARLLERAGNFSINGKEVSITALPLAQTNIGDFTGYIQTNLMSITDGHIFFDHEYYLQGARPAINIFMSVTRVGRQTQSKLLRNVGFEILSLLKKHREYQKYQRFGAEIPEKVKEILDMGDRLSSLMNQTGFVSMPVNVSMLISALIVGKVWTTESKDKFLEKYQSDSGLKNKVDSVIERSESLAELIINATKDKEVFLKSAK